MRESWRRPTRVSMRMTSSRPNAPPSSTDEPASYGCSCPRSRPTHPRSRRRGGQLEAVHAGGVGLGGPVDRHPLPVPATMTGAGRRRGPARWRRPPCWERRWTRGTGRRSWAPSARAGRAPCRRTSRRTVGCRAGCARRPGCSAGRACRRGAGRRPRRRGRTAPSAARRRTDRTGGRCGRRARPGARRRVARRRCARSRRCATGRGWRGRHGLLLVGASSCECGGE